MTIYPDSSFLVSGYLMDVHTPDFLQRMSRRPLVLVTAFHRAEVANAIFQQVYRGQTSVTAAESAFAAFKSDCNAGVWVFTDQRESTFSVCLDLAKRHTAALGVRTLDTLHVAAALGLRATHFWTFDQRQAQLAEAAGLVTS